LVKRAHRRFPPMDLTLNVPTWKARSIH
jgi:hypothetical protein